MADQTGRELLKGSDARLMGLTNDDDNGTKKRSRRDAAAIKRRCVSTACIACRRRKSKCDGNTPSCAACSSVYGTECVYDPNSDHRRKGVYKEKVDSLKTKHSTLQTLIQAILNATEDDVPALVRQIRTCQSLDDVAESIIRQEQGFENDEGFDLLSNTAYTTDVPTFETEVSGKMGELRLENGSVRFIGGTSNLIYLEPEYEEDNGLDVLQQQQQQQGEPLSSWTTVTKDPEVIVHLINMYFTWHYPYFTTLSKSLFYREFLLGKPPTTSKRTVYCSALLVNAMLALGCHFTNSPAAYADPNDPATKGDAFFHECKRLIVENDEYEKPKLTTVQALALMSVREAGCAREAKGWVYSGMSFRMAQDMGLNLDSGGMTNSRDPMDEKEIDARRITFWGCFLFDKCWSNYLGRLPQLPASNITVPRHDVFPGEDADIWSPYTDNGFGQMHSQPSRTRAIASQISNLCEISSDLLIFFYHPQQLEKSAGKAAELKKLSELHMRLEAWRRDLPGEFEPKEGQLPNVLLMHIFYHLLYIHLFRPFLKYNPSTSPLPTHVSPRKLSTQAASQISKLMRLYKRTYGLRQICNIAVYMVHSACTIHLLNLPEKMAKRDIIHGVKHLEEIAEDWLCARRTLSILSVLARKWKIELPEEASMVLARTDAKYGTFNPADVPSPQFDASYSVQPVPASSPRGLSTVNPRKANNQYYVSEEAKAIGGTTSSMSNNVGGTGASAGLQKNAGIVARFQNYTSPVPSPLPPDNAMQLATPYRQHQQYTMPESTPTSLSHHQSGSSMASSETSPNTMFGGIDALVESQNWWLRDQASLAVGFDNWGNNMEGVDGVGMAGTGGGFFTPPNRSGNINGTGFGDDEWYS